MDSIDLTRSEYALLRKIMKAGRYKPTEAEANALVTLLENELVWNEDSQENENGYPTLTGWCFANSSKAEHYYLIHKRNTFKWWFPLAISYLLSVAALIISFIALLLRQ